MTAASAALFKQALRKFRRRDVRGGLDDLEKAIQLDPSQWEYFWTRGACDYRCKFYTSAEADLTKAIELCPDAKRAAKIHERRMLCYGYLEKPDQVVQDANWLIEHGFGNVSIYQWRGWGRFSTGDLSGAISDYSQVVNLLPPEAFEVRLDRAFLYCETKRYDQALEDVNEFINLSNKPPYMGFGNESEQYIAYRFRAFIFSRMGDFEKSFADYNQAMQVVRGETIPDIETYMRDVKGHLEDLYSSGPAMPTPVITLVKSQDE